MQGRQTEIHQPRHIGASPALGFHQKPAQAELPQQGVHREADSGKKPRIRRDHHRNESRWQGFHRHHLAGTNARKEVEAYRGEPVCRADRPFALHWPPQLCHVLTGNLQFVEEIPRTSGHLFLLHRCRLPPRL